MLEHDASVTDVGFGCDSGTARTFLEFSSQKCIRMSEFGKTPLTAFDNVSPNDRIRDVLRRD